jgi:hypothetical protein
MDSGVPSGQEASFDRFCTGQRIENDSRRASIRRLQDQVTELLIKCTDEDERKRLTSLWERLKEMPPGAGDPKMWTAPATLEEAEERTVPSDIKDAAAARRFIMDADIEYMGDSPDRYADSYHDHVVFKHQGFEIGRHQPNGGGSGKWYTTVSYYFGQGSWSAIDKAMTETVKYRAMSFRKERGLAGSTSKEQL